MNKCYKIIRVIKKFSHDLPDDALLIIFMSFIRAIANYCHIIYEKSVNESFKIYRVYSI